MKYLQLFEEFNETIAGLNRKPNISPNPILQGSDEDDRLAKIRQYKGTVKDYKEYWDDRINKGNTSTTN